MDNNSLHFKLGMKTKHGKEGKMRKTHGKGGTSSEGVPTSASAATASVGGVDVPSRRGCSGNATTNGSVELRIIPSAHVLLHLLKYAELLMYREEVVASWTEVSFTAVPGAWDTISSP
jgi:hypothetical protein